MDRRQLIIVGGIVVLGLLLAFPLTWIFDSSGRIPSGSGVGVSYRSAVRQTDEAGTEWVIRQTNGLPAPKDANGVQAKPTIIVKTDVFRAREREMLIGLVLAGPNGQRYQPVVVKGGARLLAPRLRIVDESGKVLLDDSFRYG